MSRNYITEKQGVCMVVLFIIGSASLVVMGLEAKMDIWVAILMAMAASVLVMLIYARLLSVLPNKDFFDTLEFFLGKAGSKIVIFLFTWFCFSLCGVVLRDYGQFIITVGISETPLAVAMFSILVVCIFAVRSGIEVIGRWAERFMFYVLGFMVLSVILVSQNMNFTNILPIFDGGIEPIAKGALSVVSFPFAETVAFLLVFPALEKGISPSKIFLKGLLIGGGIILITSLTDILVLGPTIAENMYYPSYMSLATINFGDFLQRFEVLAAVIFILAIFLKITILLYAASKGTARLFGFSDYRFIVFSIAFLVINYALISFDSMVYFYEWTFKVWPYYAPVFQIVLPIVLLIIIEIKQKKKNKAVEVKR